MTTQTASIIGADKVMDVRPIPCSIKHGLILKTWRELPVGDHFILLNDHDPVPLRYQFEAEFPGTFTWDYLERGPEDFRVKLTKLQELPPPVASERVLRLLGALARKRTAYCRLHRSAWFGPAPAADSWFATTNSTLDHVRFSSPARLLGRGGRTSPSAAAAPGPRPAP